ncbi:DNA internalization-related competence protein ComEC/Rec2 [Lentilactobacillus curieae]|uniref:DNA internalization-related competence protein ComEC/Rec2 n=2 Tax=Lentilactobacillus curieae TaxID=1138822 RepID=A0A1S6QL07_9LACO|nr:DNA internalization-related competence protein ComEC/Rec2 [Lentilactobacillus curieae]
MRVWKLNFNVLWIVALIVGTLFTWRCLTFKQQVEMQTVNSEIHETIRIFPDEIKLNGGQINLVANSHFDNKKRVYFSRLSSESQKLMIQRNNGPLFLTVVGKLEKFKPATNVNEFDTGLYYRHQGISSLVNVTNLTVVPAPAKIQINELPHALRTGLLCRTANYPPNIKRYCQALVIGVRDSDFYQEMTGSSKLGLLHVFSVSGMHVAFFLGLVERLLAGVKFPKRTSALLKIICLVVYFQFAGGSPGLFRAVIMAVLRQFAVLLGRDLSSLDSWSITLILQLFWLPEATYLLSVQLSYSLSLGIIATAKWKLFSKTVMLNMISLPILLENFYQWHILSILASLVFLPIFSVIIFPLVLAASVFGDLPIVISIAERIVSVFTASLNFCGELPGMIVFGKPGVWITIVLLVVTFWVTLSVHNSRRKLLLVGLSCMYLCTFIWIHFPMNGEVTMIDVGQGDSFLIRRPFNRRVTLIDTGGKVHFGERPWQRQSETYRAERIGINYLKSIGINTVDEILLSHQDADHCGDLPAYMKQLRVKRVVVPIGMNQNPSFIKRLKKAGTATELVPVSDKQNCLVGGLRILHPFVAGKGENHDSMVVFGNIGHQRWLFTGDLDQAGEIEVLQRYPNLKVDVLKAGHHGSKTSSAPDFIRTIKPRIALISAGRNNRYHHPNDETMQTLRCNRVKVINSQISGMVRYVYRNNRGRFVPTVNLKGS